MRVVGSGLREGWKVRKLGEVCDFQGGSQPPKSQFIYENKEGYVRFLQIRDFKNNKNITYIPESKKNRYCNKDDVLLGRYGASVGKILINKAGAYNVAVMKTIPNKDLLLTQYLFFYLTSSEFQTNLLNVASRSAQDGFSKKDIFNFSVLIPPLQEQKKIVAILDEAFLAIEKAKANAELNLQNAKELFESYLQGVFENRGEGWEEKSLNDVCVVQRGSSPRPIKKYITESEDGVNWIKIGDTKKVNKYIYTTNQKITKEGSEKSRYVKEGDFILSNSMSFGKPYIMKTDGYIHDGWFVLRLYEFVDTEYFFQLLSSSLVNEQFHKLASGSVVKNISGDLVKKVILPIPPLNAQKQIVKKLNTLQEQTKKLESIYTQKLSDLEELKKSLLQKAFSGELI
ncbi:MAG TPA: restriction endonuclease subunit S [Sulfurimonas sp.]|nr:restriction endonuclease subunit S [Sulfurimonas sp.]